MNLSTMSPKTHIYHVYIRVDDLGMLFYREEDRLVYYTICATIAKRYNVKVLAAALMFTHIHLTILVEERENLSDFLRDVGSIFVRTYNWRYSRKGKLLDENPGKAEKESLKKIRSNIIYVFNNHIEKGLCSKATKHRWSFLAYAEKKFPFSDSIGKNASRKLLCAIRLVDRHVMKNKFLEYQRIDVLLKKLNTSEREQFFDYVIQAYSLIDFSMAASYFKDIPSMILATESTTGSEYDMKEEYIRLSDIPYTELLKFAEENGFLSRIYTMNSEERLYWIEQARHQTSAKLHHLKKFFHYEFTIEK